MHASDNQTLNIQYIWLNIIVNRQMQNIKATIITYNAQTTDELHKRIKNSNYWYLN